MRKNFYFGRRNRRKPTQMSWDVKVQLVVIAAFLIAVVISYVVINLVYA